MELRGTTILAVRHKGHVALIGDGQVTMGQSIVMKHTAKKVRRMYKDQIVAGFAGATADAFTLFERFDAHLEQTGGNLIRAAVELAKDWRSDKFLRKLEAMLLVADRDHTLVLTGTGDVIEPDDGIASIGSGGSACSPTAITRWKSCNRCEHQGPTAMPSGPFLLSPPPSRLRALSLSSPPPFRPPASYDHPLHAQEHPFSFAFCVFSCNVH